MKDKLFISVIIVLVVLVAFHIFIEASYTSTGIMQYGFIAIFIIFLIAVMRNLKNWLFAIAVLTICTSCNYVKSDTIGVWVKNFGRKPTDYSIVTGKYPKDFTRSTWILFFPGKPFIVEIEPLKVSCKDGASVIVDPSVLCQLEKSNEAARKYAFLMASYRDDVEGGLETAINRETVDIVREVINSAQGDSVMFNQNLFSTKIQDKLENLFSKKYGITLSQFSLGMEFPASLQASLNERLLAEQEAKKTLASLANQKALVELETIKAQRAKIEQAALTPAMLRKMELETMTEIYYNLSKSPNKVIVVGDPSKIIVQK